MKVLLVSALIIFVFIRCGGDKVELPLAGILAEGMSEMSSYHNDHNESFDSSKEDMAVQSGCFLSNNFTATLFTTQGHRIRPSHVQPNTQYIVRVRLTIPNRPCCQNPAYCFNTAIGFTGDPPRDSNSGDLDFRIITDSSIIPGVGIIGIVQAIGCDDGPRCGASGSSNNVRPIE